MYFATVHLGVVFITGDGHDLEHSWKQAAVH